MKHFLLLSALTIMMVSSCDKKNETDPENPSSDKKDQTDPMDESLKKGLMAYYPFDGNANDMSMNAFHGTVYGAGLCSDRSGNPNAAYNFKGSTDYIDLPNSNGLKCQLPVSVSCWANFNNMKRFYFLFTSDYVEDKYTGYWLGLSSNGVDTVITTGYGDGGDSFGNGISAEYRRSKVGSTRIIPNKWYHITVVIKGPLDMDIFINGQNDGGKYDGFGGAIQYSTHPGSIGRKDCSYNTVPPSFYYLNGKVDELRVYNRILSQEEIIALSKR